MSWARPSKSLMDSGSLKPSFVQGEEEDLEEHSPREARSAKEWAVVGVTSLNSAESVSLMPQECLFLGSSNSFPSQALFDGVTSSSLPFEQSTGLGG